MVKEKNGFNLRSFTSFALVISTLVMSWSGFILFIAPPGRIANRGTWNRQMERPPSGLSQNNLGYLHVMYIE